VQGEGEETLRELLRTIAAGAEYGAVRGIAYRDAAGYRCTEVRPQINLDDYPPFAAGHDMFGPIEITRGCPFACAYCQTSHIMGTTLRHRSIDCIADRIRQAQRVRRLKYVRVITPDAFAYGSADGRAVNHGALHSLLHALRAAVGPRGQIFFGSFPSEVRPEHVTPEAVRLVKKYANNDNLVIGAQSGSQRMLDCCRRGHTVRDIFSAVSITLKHGFKAYVDFMFGLPGETDADMDETIAVMRELAAMGAKIHAHTFMPLPRTGFASEEPGRVSSRLLPELKKLLAGKAAFGAWREQERQAQRIAAYMRTGEL
jgi:B12-binding domain/radical SAM domain protein